MSFALSFCHCCGYINYYLRLINHLTCRTVDGFNVDIMLCEHYSDLMFVGIARKCKVTTDGSNWTTKTCKKGYKTCSKMEVMLEGMYRHFAL